VKRRSATPDEGGEGFPREARITSSDEIRALFRRGKRRKTSHFDVFVSTSPVARSRVGLVVPKPKQSTSPEGRRVRGAAVRRNLLKRRLREIARTRLLPELDRVGAGVDILIRARPEAYKADYATIAGELVGLEEWICSRGS
jgi:ribonuclease P protein component